MEDFQASVEACLLHGLRFSGPKFTWSNKRGGVHFVKERLDRALANSTWTNLYPLMQIEVLAACCLDHAPLLISCDGRE
jgi:hypothetical protein